MKNFIKENWFKIGLLVIFLLFILGSQKESVFSPIRNISESKYLELSKQCKIDAQKNLEEDMSTATQEKLKADVSDCFYLPPMYLFSKELNTCLYYGGYSCDLKKFHKDGIFKGESFKRWSKHITDVYTNKNVIDVYVEDSSNVAEWNMEFINEFNDKATQLGF